MESVRNRVFQYVEGVLSGKIVACRWVKLACERHMRDLAEGDARGLWFDEREATAVCEFFGFLSHSKGEWGGTPIILEDWELFVMWVLFGWRRADGTRRFRTSYLEIARKNGKSTLAAGVGLYLLVADGEAGAEIYSAASKRDQARITHAEAVRMVRQSAPLRKRLTIFKDNIHIKGTASLYQPLGRDADTMDGLNVHAAIVDELHAHPTGELWDVLETGMGSRRQPLMFAITTAGHNRETICFAFNERTKKILEGIIEDDSWFGIIFTLDEGDNWEDETVWIKANPNLGVSKKWDQMRRMAARAKDMPARLSAFLQKELNVWVSSASAWLNMDAWGKCEIVYDEESLIGRTCYGALDLSSKIDLSAWALIFPPVEKDEKWKMLVRYWMPEENVFKRVHDDRVPYDAWIREGYIEATDGNVIDYEVIEARVMDDAKKFRVMEAAFDPWSATGTANRLDKEGLTMVEFRQGYRSFSEPMKDSEAMILSQKFGQNGNPVLTWNASNLVATQDPAGNLKPDKEKSGEKIDGMVAVIMALGRALTHQGKDQSVYEERGLVVL